MAKSEHLKYRSGPVRQPQVTPDNGTGHWYVDRSREAEIKQRFGGGRVPNNPLNYQSFVPNSSSYANDAPAPGETFRRQNPYGDGEQVVVGTQPVLTKPDQWGAAWRSPAPAATDGDKQPGGATFGFDPAQSPLARFDSQSRAAFEARRADSEPRGMSTGMSRFGSGPQRNVTRKGNG